MNWILSRLNGTFVGTPTETLIQYIVQYIVLNHFYFSAEKDV